MSASTVSSIRPSLFQELLPGLWIVRGSLPKRSMPRNMVIHRLADGGLLIHSAIALDEEGMRQLESLGRPSLLIVPNGFHRLDAPFYKARYPHLKVLCPARARKAVEKVIAVDESCEAILPSHGVVTHAPSGIVPSELVYEFISERGHALVMTDLMMNLPAGLPGIEGLMLHLFGPGRYFGVTRIAKFLLVKDKPALRNWLTTMAVQPKLAAIVVAHGEPITQNLAAALQGAAERL